MPHIGKVVYKFLHGIEVEGHFNEVPLDSIVYESVWFSEYAIFCIYFETWDLPYFNEDEFHEDFKENLLEICGENVEINIRCGKNEYEIIGPNYKEVYKKYQEMIESDMINFPKGRPIIMEF